MNPLAGFAAVGALLAFGLSRFPEGVVCGRRFGKLTATTRKRLPDRMFGLPECRNDPSCPDLPMPDSSHAASAKGRARTALRRRRITRAQFDRAIRKANSILRKCGGIPETTRPLRKQVVTKRCIRFKKIGGVRRCAKFKKVA